MPTLHDVMFGPSHDDPAPPPESTGPPPLPDRAHIVPWTDPVVDAVGHDPRSSYVEQFWLSVLGPSAVWAMRLFASGFDRHPDGYELDVADAARTLGLSVAKGASSPFGRSIQRCVIFGMALTKSDGWAVRRRMPAVTTRHLQRLPEAAQLRHADWTSTTVRLDELERAHLLAAAMMQAGDDPGVLTSQLVAVGISPPAAEEASRLALVSRFGARPDRSTPASSTQPLTYARAAFTRRGDAGRNSF
ncbi:MAG: hypothetical protein ACK5OX_06030 [Desertimonas sp.]